MVADGETVPHGELTTAVRLGGTTVEDAVDLSRVGERLASGATLVLQGLQRTWPPLIRFCRSLERESSHPVQANAYLTPPASAGLGEHADGHDVFVLQVRGRKAWEIEELGPVELGPGDVLYMPTGTRHRASAQQDVSLHLTIGLLTDTYRSVVRRALAGVAELDSPLPIGWAHAEKADELAAGIGAALTATAAHLKKAAMAADAVAEVEAARARSRRRPLLTGHIASVLAPIDDATVVRCREDNPARIEAAGDEVVVNLVDRTIRVPSHAGPALAMIVEQIESTVGDLPGLDEPSRAVLVRRLIREGMLEVVQTLGVDPGLAEPG